MIDNIYISIYEHFVLTKKNYKIWFITFILVFCFCLLFVMTFDIIFDYILFLVIYSIILVCSRWNINCRKEELQIMTILIIVKNFFKTQLSLNVLFYEC